MTRNGTGLRLIACLAAARLVCAPQVHAQRPVISKSGNITVPTITRPPETDGAYRLAAERFRGSVSLTVVDLPTSPRTGMRGVDVTWALHPGATRYRVLRGVTATSPWIPVHEDGRLRYTFEYLPGGQSLFVRVVPMRQEEERYVAIDTSAVGDIMTAYLATHFGGYGIPGTRCRVQAPLTAVIHWPPVPLASAYEVHITRDGFALGVHTLANLGTQTVRDSSVSFTDASDGVYSYTVFSRFDFPDWLARGDTLRQMSLPSIAQGRVSGGIFTCLTRT